MTSKKKKQTKRSETAENRFEELLGRMRPETAAFLKALPVTDLYEAVPSWWVLEVPDGDLPRPPQRHPNAQSAAAHVRRLLGTDVSVVVFHGVMASITRGPFRYLRYPGGQDVPLFAATLPGEAEDDGFLGDERLTRLSILEPEQGDDEEDEADDLVDEEEPEGD